MNKVYKFLMILLSLNLFSQTDRNGNPVFNSVTVSEEKLNGYQLNTNYYTIDNNINNKNSSVFMSENPTLDQVEKFATKLPSDFFLIVKDNSPINMVMVVENPDKKYFVINPSTGNSKTFECNLQGDITETRAKEIIEKKYDSTAKIIDNKLFFNNKEFKIISSDELKKGITKLIEKEKLNEGKASDLKIADKALLRKTIIDESKVGGKLDFFTEIKGQEMDGIQVKKGIFSTKQNIAIYKWGRANFEMGVNTFDDAIEIWGEIKGRKANQREIDYIKMGFNKELEK
ncbi:hypothetical protein PQ459_09785 [Chryseobacterium sp. KACC 21268]|nr:hypothetical protein PQ459_09785 [Chryseobacterium sp. KACC 21268]